ncbi:thioredoxin 2 [Desulfobaculum xiamenense]|uniref:Thioredoxin 2 n=1 Tax=Desulfobaculum xiamenense TaxID=995050 RepID=A0A846QN53_9BACT|nr:thioredoxin domain-containing protein [Desulfobaculum xiamenense]NJB66664.1 thioredoxin 2 [Desulfobaculum xiamenense]
MNETVTVPCPNCLATNRVIVAKLRNTPECGRCGSPLLPSVPVRLGSATFRAFMERSGLPVIVNFQAPWCPHCRRMAPEFERAARVLGPAMLLAVVDTQREEALAAHHRIESVPTTVIFRNSTELARLAGAMDAEQLASWAMRFA